MLMTSDRIFLPEKLQMKSITPANKGNHPGVNQAERRLRCNFFFHESQNKVINYVDSCLGCKAFIDKKTFDPFFFPKVSSNNWEVLAVDLYGPMSSNNHVVGVQGLGSRYPAA